MQGNARERLREGNEAGVVGKAIHNLRGSDSDGTSWAYETHHIETQLVSRWRWREGQEWNTMGV